MQNLIEPPKLRKGDTVAAISLSWGGASLFKERYEYAKKYLCDTFQLNLIPTPNAFKSPEWIYEHPQERLNDLMWCLTNDNVSGIISIIGGDDSIRIYRYIEDSHLDIIKNNPKIFVGMSDTTTINFLFSAAGIKSLYGPSVLYGFAENGGMGEYAINSVRNELFEPNKPHIIPENQNGWTLDKVPWKEEFQYTKRKMQEHMPWKYIQGKSPVQGHLLGGCADVLEMIKGTKFWPNLQSWNGAILFLETSEEKPSPDLFKMWLRNYGATGILERLSGILFARPGGEIKFTKPDYKILVQEHIAQFDEFDTALIEVCKEYGRDDLPIVSRLDFGHSWPMFTIPFGSTAKIDPERKQIEILT